ncbi:hypothetical protein [Erwinia rhapontici]|uniref:hypothetical protein n=1 Tax=Erwinia rhapontici TaxID=55212 RepID=UPI0013314CF2|nr:hypothetical protein [Erwinia rhapontici]MBP2153412.1 hypothetical protein [Erwinia rhapontici]
MFDIFKILITAITTLVFTGVVGNKIIIKFQRDNWLYQQKFQNNEKDLKEFEKVVAEINSLVSSRISRMRIYIDEKVSNDGKVEDATRAGYINIKNEWNDKINNFYHFLYTNESTDLSMYLEKEIQEIFVSIHNDMRQADISELKKTKTMNKLNLLSNKSSNLMKLMEERKRQKRSSIYDETRIFFTKENLDEFPTLFMLKALFFRFPNAHSISRSPFSSNVPSGRLK